MNFYSWMMKNCRNEQSPRGDLAGDMYFDRKNFPRNRSRNLDDDHGMILYYLNLAGACDGCIEAFEECWEEYVECEKSRLNGNSR